MELDQWLKGKRGRAKDLAVFLGVSQPTVSDWGTREKPIPVERCPFIESFTQNQVSCEEQRPDYDGWALLREHAARQVKGGAACVAGQEDDGEPRGSAVATSEPHRIPAETAEGQG